MATFEEMYTACKEAFGVDCEKWNFSEIFHVYPTKESFYKGTHRDFDLQQKVAGNRSKLINGYYVYFDKEAYRQVIAREALETGLIRDDYDETKNVVFLDEGGDVHWIYFNPDANSGAQFVENCIYSYLIEEVANKDDWTDKEFFDYLEGECRQYLWDCYEIEDYRAYADTFDAEPDTKLDHDLRTAIIRNLKTR